MYQSNLSHFGFPVTPRRHIAYQTPKQISPQGTTSFHSSPLTPPITSPNSAFQSPYAAENEMGWPPNFGRTLSNDKSKTAGRPNNSRSTGWGAPRNGTASTDGRIYSHDMAGQYFTLAQHDESVREVQGKRSGGTSFMQRIMHRTNSCYPLPCDDQEQQVRRRVWSVKQSLKLV